MAQSWFLGARSGSALFFSFLSLQKRCELCTWPDGCEKSFFFRVDELDHPWFFAALNQTPLNCDGTNDAQATWQRRLGCTRSQQLRTSICIFRWCPEGLHSDDSHKKKSSFATGFVFARSRGRRPVSSRAHKIHLIRRRHSPHETHFLHH